MIKQIIFFFLTMSLTVQVSGQDLHVSGERLSEGEISLEDLYIAAKQKRLLGKYDDAIKLYKRLMDKNEVNASVHHDMARIYEVTGEKEKAISSARKAVRYDNTNHWYVLTLAQIYEGSMRFEEAANSIHHVIKMAPAEGLYHRWAEYLDLAGRKNEAINAYDIADSKYGWSEDRSDSKVDLYLGLGKKKEAVKEVKKWTEKNPNSLKFWTKLARFYEYQGDLKKTRKTYKKVLDLNPDDEEALYKTRDTSNNGDDQSQLRTLISDSRIGIDNKIKSIIPFLGDKLNYQEVLSMCESLITQYPDNAKTYALHGDAYWLAGDAEHAVVEYQKSLDISKSVYQVWDQLMAATNLLKDYDQLNKISTEALDYYPNQSGPYYYSAIGLLAKGKQEEAYDINEEAIFIGEAAGGYIAEQSQILKSTILDSQGKSKLAIDNLELLDPTVMTSGLYELLGDLYFKTGEKADAEKAWVKSMSMGGDKTRIELKLQSI